MTASSSAEASDDAARPLTDEELGAEVRRIRLALANCNACDEALGQRVQAIERERLQLNREAAALRARLTELVGPRWPQATGGMFKAADFINVQAADFINVKAP